MAVEIPVIINIDQAFQDAAARVDQAIKPLAKKIDQETADIKLKVGVDVVGEGKEKEFIDRIKTVNELLTITKKEINGVTKYSGATFEELAQGIESAKARLMELSAVSARYELSAEQLSEQQGLQRTIILLRQEMDIRQHAAELVDRQAQGTINAKRAEEERLAVISRSATTMAQLSEKMSALQGQLQNTEIGSPEWLDLLDTIKQVGNEIERVQKDMVELGQESGSLDALNNRLREIQTQFATMGKQKLFDENGKPTEALKAIQKEYADVRNEIDKTSEALTAEYDAQKKLREEEEKEKATKDAAAEAQQKQREEAEAHQKVLYRSSKTIEELREQIAAWRGEMEKAPVGSDQFVNAAVNVGVLTGKMRELNSEIGKLGHDASSIDALSARMQALTQEYNSLSMADRSGARGQQIVENAIMIADSMEEEAKSLANVVNEERQRIKLIQKEREERDRENKILEITATTMRELQEQERILQDRLNKAKIGSGTYDKLKKQLDAVRASMGSVKQETKETTVEFSNQQGTLGRLVTTFASYVSIHSLLRFAGQIREVTGELEYQRVALGHLIQDEEYGAALFERIKKAAVESPFRIKDLVTYTKQLAAYRIETTQLYNTTKMLADVSAGLGVDMNRLILAYGQVRAASVLRGQELRQFTEAGIPLVELLADKFTELRGVMVSTADVFELISKRAVPFSMISEIFQDMTSIGGQFFEMQETQAKTLQGRWEKLKDTFDIALQSIGESEGLFNFRNEFNLLYGILELVAKNLRVIPKLLSAATVALVGYRIAVMQSRIQEEGSIVAKKRLTTEELKQIIVKRGNTAATKAYTKAVMAQKAATTALSKAFWKLAAAMLANPITAILTGIAALTLAFISFRKKTEEATESAKKLSEWTDTIERQGEVVSQNKRMDQLISRYERLASKSKLTAKEQQSLSQTMRILSSQFKDVNLEIGNANNSVSQQAKKLRELNKTQKETAITTLQLTKAQIEARLALLGQQEQQQTKDWIAASKRKSELEENVNRTRKESRELRRVTKDYEKYGDQLNETSTEINTLQNRLVSIENILNPQSGVTGVDAETDRLSRLKNAINDVTNAYKKFQELLEYEGRGKALQDIATLFPSLDGWEPTFENMISVLEGMLDKYKGDADATRLIEQAIANVKFDKLKSAFEDKLKKLEDDIKRSETARKFYENIFDLTGDAEIAKNLTFSIYGDIGKDFKDRLQEQLYRTLNDLEPEEIDKDLLSQLMGDIAILDIDDITANLDKLPKKVRETFTKVLAENQKYNAEYLSGLYKTYSKAMDYEKRIQAVRDREAAERSRIMANEAIPETEKQALLDASRKKELQDIASIQVENLKNQDEWKQAFENLEKVGNKTLVKLKNDILAIIEAESGNMLPEDLKALREELEKIDATLATRDPFTAIKNGMQRATLVRGAMLQEEGTAAYDEAIEKIRKFNETAQDTEKIDIKNLENSFRSANKEIEDGINGVKEYLEAWQGVVDTLVDAFDLDEVPVLGDTLKGVSDALSFVAGILPVIITLNQILNGTLMLNPIIAAGAGIVATIGGIVGLIKGIINAKVERLNKKIEEQKRIIDQLDRSYQRLEKAIADAFGSDYIYNYTKQLENLAAKQAAYEEQARLEREKGKKADEDKIKEYQQSAEDAASDIVEMRGQLAEFFTGTDVASAAKDFANSWIEAYKEFGSTTDAMKEKFQDMIQEMVEQSLGAKIVQTILQPLFKEIDDMAKEGGELSAQEIAQIAKSAPEYIDQINGAMTTLMNQLAAAGYNVRQGVGQFTGISRDIAGASEESINGLAAGINTQNFYMSQINQNVAAILASMTGGTDAAGVTRGAAAASEDPYKNQMLQFAGMLPEMHDDMHEVRRLLALVVRPTGATSTHYVATRS